MDATAQLNQQFEELLKKGITIASLDGKRSKLPAQQPDRYLKALCLSFQKFVNKEILPLDPEKARKSYMDKVPDYPERDLFLAVLEELVENVDFKPYEGFTDADRGIMIAAILLFRKQEGSFQLSRIILQSWIAKDHLNQEAV
ncbi:MAG: hypothetical protein KBC22_01265 [Candidatus Pacebacteria bacterium]|nr:hypothetical protein [Candidatus Paceibacterota bacterium]